MDPTWKDSLQEGAVSGTVASLLSAAALALAGARQTPSAAAPINATSQWLWGQREALKADHPDRRHTLNGYLIHHLAASFWAVLHARVLRDQPALARPGPALAAAAATSVIAALADLKLTPERFTPGFQHRVSTPALVGTYACFAVGLALGSMAMHRRREQRRIAG